MRLLTTGRQGEETMVGLTQEESFRYLAYSRRFLLDRSSQAGNEQDDYFHLYVKHERARQAIIAAEAEARQVSVRH
ncbi:hypothetical protein GCM10027040_11010 [Halomonas shantousis]